MTSQDNPELRPIEHFLELENTVWRALCAGDAQADEEMLSPEFLGVYPSGFSDRAGHTGQVTQGPSVSRYRIDEARVMHLGPNHAMLSYLATFLRPNRATEERMYVSSLWARQGQVWRNVFSQDTPAAGN